MSEQVIKLSIIAIEGKPLYTSLCINYKDANFAHLDPIIRAKVICNLRSITGALLTLDEMLLRNENKALSEQVNEDNSYTGNISETDSDIDIANINHVAKLL